MNEFRIRRRARLKTKEADALRAKLVEAFGPTDLWPETAAVEVGELPDYRVILVDNHVVGLIVDERPFLTVRGLLKYRPAGAYVTVDMGAVRFVHNGADVMAPGIVDADARLAEGDWCWIRDQNNKQPLAVGQCLIPGAAMAAADKGKAVRSIHHLGDKLWDIDA